MHRRLPSTLVLLSLLAALLVATAAPAAAAPDDLLISEYVEGTSNHKAIEIFNGTGAAVDLAAGGYALRMYFNGSATATLTIPLQGTVADGDVHVVAHSSADAAILAQADQTNGAGWFNGDDVVELVRDGATVDVIGQVGVDPGTEWGSGLVSTADNTLRRMATVCAGDTDPTDPFDPSAEWEGFATNTFDGLGAHTTDCDGGDGGDGGHGGDVDVVINEVDSDTPGTDVLEFVELYDGGIGGTDLSGLVLVLYNGSTDTSYRALDLDGQTTDEDGFWTWCNAGVAGCDAASLPDNTLQNGPDAVALHTGDAADFPNGTSVTDDGLIDAVVYDTADADAAGLLAVLTPGQPQVDENGGGSSASHSIARCPDGGTPRDTSTYVTAAPTPGAPNDCGGGTDLPDCYAAPPEVTLISCVQGTGAASPLDDHPVRVRAIVTSLFEDDDTLDGFFVQEEDTDADADPATSEGLFVFCRGVCLQDLAVGDLVDIVGVVDEFFGMTQITVTPAGSSVTVEASGHPLPAPVPVDLPATGSTLAEATFERLEGMHVTFPDTLVVSEYFELARFGHLVLTETSRPHQFTHVAEPDQAGYQQFMAELETRRIFLDDNTNDQNDATEGPLDNEPYPYPEGGLSIDHTFRGGDTITGLSGVMHWSFAGQSGTDAWRIRPIPEVHDYVFEPANPRTDAPDAGGTLTVASFNVLNYFDTIDETSSNTSGPCGPSGDQDCRGADSLVELERQQAKIVAALAAIDADVVGLIEIENDTTSVQHLVDGLNAVLGAGTYAAIDTGEIGTDAIKVAFIYQPDSVVPVGDFAIMDSAVDPRFDDDANRPALIQTFEEVATGERFTAVVNHLKSKGSACDGDPDVGDGQGNCNVTRTEAAQALADHLATDPTGSGDPDVLIIGDLNAYRNEDPIRALETAGYIDLLEQFEGDDAYTYVFDGQLGYLDHGLANASLVSQVTGAAAWHINADEVPLLDYNDTIHDAGEAAFERESTALPLYSPDPFRSSDHDPVIIGLDLGDPGVPLLCFGLVPTIIGTPGDDVINGTNGDDVIMGLGGQDRINGGNGNDVICGGDGDDQLVGGNGNDRIDGGAGHDRLEGGNGNDVLLGGDGDDRLYGDNGDDVLDGGDGNDRLEGGNGNDTMDGGDGDDQLLGHNGNDTMYGGPGHDTLNGHNGRDACAEGEQVTSCEVAAPPRDD